MAENAGDIVYTVGADVEPLVASTKQVDTQLNSMNGTMKKSDAAVGQLGRRAGQAGIQLQQFIGQIQGGQSAMLALSQQSADLGFVLGAPLLGAITGIAASMAGLLLPNLFHAESATDKLKETLEALQKIVITNEQGVNALSNSFAALAKKSSEIAKAQLALSITQATQAIDLSKKAAIDATAAYDDWFNGFDVASNGLAKLEQAQDRTGKSVTDLLENTNLYATGLTQLASFTDSLNSKFGTTTEESFRLVKAFDDLQKSSEPDAINDFSKVITDISLNTEKATPDLQKLTVEINKLALKSASSQEVLKLLKEAYGDLGNTLKTTSEEVINARISVEKYAEALKEQADLVGKSRSETLEYKKALALQKAAQAGVNQETKESLETSFDKLIADAKATEQAQKQANADREAAAASRERAKANKDFIKDFGKPLTADETDDFATGYAASITQENKTIFEELQNQRDMINMFQELGLGDAQQNADALLAIKNREAKEELKLQSGLLSASSDFFGSSADLISNFGGEASNAYKALFAVSKGFAIANAALQLQTSIANASALPWPANLGAITLAVSQGAAIASNIASLTYAGGRESGGPVSAGSFYRMGEGNKPEVLQTSSGMYGIPGDNGRVFNSQQLDQISGGSGGSNVNIQVINEPGVSTVVTKDEMGVYMRNAINTAKKETASDYSNSMNNRSGTYFNSTAKNYGQGKASGRSA